MNTLLITLASIYTLCGLFAVLAFCYAAKNETIEQGEGN